jgi:hypothetical protein
MMNLLMQLEYKRQEYRMKLMSKFAHSGHDYFGLAALVLLASFSTSIFPPAALFIVPSSLVTAAELAFLGVILLFSIVAAPVGLVLF